MTSKSSGPTGHPPRSAAADVPPSVHRADSFDTLTGLGATRPAWQGAHMLDPKDPTHVSNYDPDPSVRAGSDGERDRFYSVLTNGPKGEKDPTSLRVTDYFQEFGPNTPIAEARAAVSAQLPADASSVWFRSHFDDGCDVEVYRSKLLSEAFTAAFGRPDPGYVRVNFRTSDQNSGLVWHAWVTVAETDDVAAATAGGC